MKSVSTFLSSKNKFIKTCFSKLNIILVFGLVLFLPNILSAQTFNWVTQIGGATLDDNAYSVALDVSGNSYVTGSFKDTFYDGKTVQFTSSGGADIYLAKYSSVGKLIWSVKAGGSSDDVGRAVAVDDSGNLFITGYFGSSSATFGSTSLSRTGGFDMFVAKYDNSGNLIWVKSGGGSGASTIGNVIAVDAAFDVYVGGSFTSTTSVAGTSLTSSGASDIFLAKYDYLGTSKLSKRDGGTGEDNCQGIALDKLGNFYTTGRYGASCTIAGSSLTNAGTATADIYIAKYKTSNGAGRWSKGAGGTGDERGTGIAIDGSGKIYITGYFGSSFTWGTTSLTVSGTTDVFTAKYDSGGAFIWVATGSSNGLDKAYGITADVFDNIYVIGSYQNKIFFGSLNQTSTASDDVFVVKYSAGGSPQSVIVGGGSHIDYGYGITNNNQSELRIVGVFQGPNITFNGKSIKNKSVSTYDGFITRISDNSAVAPTITASGPVTFCSGDSVVLSTQIAQGFTYQWQLNGSNISGATSSSLIVKNSGNYKVTVTTNTGTSATTVATTVTLNTLPPSGRVGSSKTLCSGATAVVGMNKLTNYLYSWTSNPV
ncbi:MAG: SBBP repeat-containing protein, partial [Bacteroidetes bacterium]|nr:SBBP repeat-containing protein [Bacteroidota bacterium]